MATQALVASPFPTAVQGGAMALNGGHTEVVRVALSLGERIITGGEDGSIAIWRYGSSGQPRSQDYETSSDRSAGGSMKAKAPKPAHARRGNRTDCVRSFRVPRKKRTFGNIPPFFLWELSSHVEFSF